jgi:hypothetical protein
LLAAFFAGAFLLAFFAGAADAVFSVSAISVTRAVRVRA